MPAQRAARKAITSKPYNRTSPDYLPPDGQSTPSLSTASDHDRSSDFEPSTPVKEEGEEEIDDIKPDLGDGEYLFSDDENYGKQKKRAKASKKSKSGGGGGSPKKLGQAWTGDEDWALFQQIHPKVSKPDWKAVADLVGRDAKACKNRYAVFGKRLEGVIRSMSGK